MSEPLGPGDRVMVSARYLRAMGTYSFGKGQIGGGTSPYCRGKGTIIGFAPNVDAICYVLWDDDDEMGVARGVNVGNLVHIQDLARDADVVQHSGALNPARI